MPTYTVDPAHSVVEFAVKHMMFSTVKGHFSNVQGTINFDAANPTTSSVSASADAASVDTRDPKRDGHLRSPDFFDVEKHPTISFRSRRVEPTSKSGTYRVIGDLTLHGVTKEIALDTSFLGEGGDPWGGRRIGITATGTINRKEFNLNWNVGLEAGGVLVGDTVTINLEVQAVFQPAEAPVTG